MKLPLILDGATGTNLTQRGMPAGVCPEKWVLENPEILIGLQKEFIDAGSDAVLAPTFGGNRKKLTEYGLADDLTSINRRLVALSRQAVGDKLVAGDITGPGIFIRPVGDATFEDLYNIFYEQAKALDDAGVDFFALETLMSLTDARAALLAVKAVSDKPVYVSLTVDENGRTLDGTDPASAAVVLASMGVDAFGLNCSAGPEGLLKVLSKVAPNCPVPLVAKPNAGLPETVDGRTVFPMQPDEFASFAEELLSLGVGYIGGCCGTTPAHIKALSEALKDKVPAAPASLPVLPADARRIYDLPEEDFTFEAIDEDLPDTVMDAEEVCALLLEEEDQLSLLEENLTLLALPLALKCDDEALLEKALRIYQGRALIAGDAASDRLVRSYGAIKI
ncbi:MAG: homocysteine S-methyltransferase family protein [Clostridia bacterium]|nr:homocysteine S-methyltransferase family protein [Clostridia bacterium]